MNFTIDRAAFLAAAKRAAQVAPSVSSLEILKCVLLEPDTGQRKLYITSTNMEMSLRQSVPLLSCEGDDTARAVSAKLLSSMLTHLAGSTVDIHESEQHTLVLSSEQATYQLPQGNRKDFPYVKIPAPSDAVKLSGLPSLVRRTAFATTQSSDMPLLKCICLRLTGEGLQAMGSDGTCIVSVKGDKQCVGSKSYLIPAAALEKLAQLCTDKDTFSVGTAGRQIVFVRDDLQFSTRLMDGNYVDVDRLIAETQNGFTVLTDGRELRRILQTASAACRDNRLLLQFKGDRLTLRCTGDAGTSHASLAVIPLTGQPEGEYCFAVDRLDRCLRALRGTVTLGIAQGGMLTLAAEDAFYMQAQLRIPAAKKAPSKKKTAKAA